jgi:cytochrome c oxidase cbb3-type subunit 3
MKKYLLTYSGLFLLLLPTVAGAQAPAAMPRMRRTPTSGLDQASVERGKTIFEAQCSFCHGVNAKGGDSGPDLIRSVTVLDDEKGDKIGPVILNGRPGKGMPKFPLKSDQILDVATFLHQKVFDAAQRSTYKIGNIVTGNAAEGQQYFSRHCASCHSPSGDLKGVGAKYDAATLESRFLMPRAGGFEAMFSSRPPDPRSITRVTVTLPDGKTYNGKLDAIDDFTVSLTTDDGDYYTFPRNGDSPKVVVHDPLQAHLDMLVKYTDTDIHNLTAYLVTLK